MVTPAQFVVILTCLLSGNTAQSISLGSSSSVLQESVFKSAHIGETVTLPCFYKEFYLKYVSWYIYILGKKPKQLSYLRKYDKNVTLSDEFKNRFTLKPGNQSSHLIISDLKQLDSATYFCIAGYQTHLTFTAAFTVDVKGSGLTIQTSVDQSSSENIHAGDSVTLNCTVHTGSCDEEHRVYWFKDSEDSHPGLIYTHGGRKDQCERKNTKTHSCFYKLYTKNLNRTHAGIYYCAVVSCGHILFGNGTKLDLTGQPNSLLVYFLTGSLTFMSIVVIFLVYKITKDICCQSKDQISAAGSTPQTEIESEDTESLHYAAINVKRSNKSRRQNGSITDCIYASVTQQN
ncbi:uncharacterized protein LOC111949274 isoform X2 [Oryzias latipes]|uniref:uncharacterized protein LOC111949274 isoform X2 n=1 Tax=Oryzias latipes TaxID=8090 RepID=UPI000CE1D059|nr:uncharacterized protein LOC111949274 isoform X2 [Oryzias latipes]